ncbi:MAG: hypothetical protein CL946_10935 [Ectothiorhodospiraceae bacterium]|nr:hypothetical protein [Ectothiorhodospiraceae bacterium]
MPEEVRESQCKVAYLYDSPLHPAGIPPKPFIRLSGYYLAKFGFTVGSRLDIRVTQDQIEIRRIPTE